ncbi:MAG: DEAD/DEAH box helicase [Verrucomicrobiae bacterium]|nr:DEAD/DEAH box helicase [Verrucomicrobiae bacterium]
MSESSHAPQAPSANRTAAPPSHSQTSKAPLGAFGRLDPKIQRALAAEGYETPTPIQENCLPALIDGRDLIGSAQTGTGKTAAFTLPILQRLLSGTGRGHSRSRPRAPRVLILAPTRELAAQIGDSIETYGRFLSFRHTVIFGGISQHRQVKALTQGVDILVATPGRLLDLMKQGHVVLDSVEIFVLDEVDRMLDMGFIHDIKQVVAKMPRDRQTVFLSATMPRKMEELAGTMVRNPVRVAITPEAPAVERIAQRVFFVGKQDKDALLHSMLKNPAVGRTIVFTQMKHAANKVVAKLERAGIPSAALHGNKSQSARTRALDGFRTGRLRVLVATDVAARGLDVDDITHVINYDLPVEAETYIHRIGRTARAGTEGDAISFCSAEDRGFLREIERLLGKPVPAEMDHEFHCANAFHSTQPASRVPGGGRGKRGGNGRPAGKSRRPSSGNPRGGAKPRRNRNWG